MEFKTISFDNSEEAASTRKTFFFAVDGGPNTQEKCFFAAKNNTKPREFYEWIKYVKAIYINHPSIYIPRSAIYF